MPLRLLVMLLLVSGWANGVWAADWLVRVADPAESQRLEALGYRLMHRYRNIPWAVYRAPEGTGTARASTGPGGLAEPVGPVTLAAIPADPRLGEQWPVYPPSPDADVHLPQGWDRRTTATAVVAVIDSGVDSNHEDLQDNLWTNPAELAGTLGVDDDVNGQPDDLHGWNVVENNADLEDSDYDRHGTGVCGVIAARGNNGVGISGVCWAARIMVIRTFIGATTPIDTILKAYDYAISNPEVRVINASFGRVQYSQAEYEMLQEAAARNIVVIAAAGNANVSLDSSTFYPASYDLDNVVSVASVNNAGQVVSSYGSRVTVAAPGVNVLTTDEDSYSYRSGSSFAAPMVSGAVALLRSEHPEFNANSIGWQLISSSRPTDSLGRPLAGGLLDFATLFNLVNAATDWQLYR